MEVSVFVQLWISSLVQGQGSRGLQMAMQQRLVQGQCSSGLQMVPQMVLPLNMAHGRWQQGKHVMMPVRGAAGAQADEQGARRHDGHA